MARKVQIGRWPLLALLVCILLASKHVQADAQDTSQRCGVDQGVANTSCGALCVDDSECADGETCWTGLDPTPCDVPPQDETTGEDFPPPPEEPAPEDEVEAPPTPDDDGTTEDTDTTEDTTDNTTEDTTDSAEDTGDDEDYEIPGVQTVGNVATFMLDPAGCKGMNVVELARMAGLPTPAEASYTLEVESLMEQYDYEGCAEDDADCYYDELFCSDDSVIISEPQDEELFLLGGLADGTEATCQTALTDVFDPAGDGISRFGWYGISLGYDLVGADPKEYTVCQDTKWKEGVATRGPLPTFVYFYNPCSQLPATIQVKMSLVEGPSASEYCKKLTTLTKGEPRAYIILIGLYVISAVMGCLLICFCFPRPICCGLTRYIGFGWVTLASQHIRVYSKGLDRWVILFPALTAMLTAYVATYQPVTDKRDILNYDYEGSVVTKSKGTPIKSLLILLYVMAVALLNACSIFGILLLAFSHPRKDPSFSAKKAIALCCLVIFDAIVVAYIVDTWAYFDEWNSTQTSVWTQVPLLLFFLASNISVLSFCWSVRAGDEAPWDSRDGVRRVVPRAHQPPAEKVSFGQKVKNMFKAVTGIPKKVAQLLCAAYEAVREDATFRYSPFMLLALVMAFLLHTANFNIAIKLVDKTANCFELHTGNSCYQHVQNVVSNRLLGFEGFNVTALKTFVNTVSDLQQAETNDTSINQIKQRVAAWEDKVDELKTALKSNRGLKWIPHTPTPVRVGGLIGYTLAYLYGLFTIYYCARSYKRVSRMIQDAKGGIIPHTELRKSDAAMIHDIDHHVVIVEGAVFTGMLTSTCLIQLWVIGSPVAFGLTAAIHQDFWITLWNLKGGAAVIIGAVLVFIVKKGTNIFLTKVPTDGHSIKRPIMWLVCFIAFSTVWLLLGFFLAFARLIVLVITSVFSFGRLDRNVYKFANKIDKGYGAFLALTTMDDTVDAHVDEAEQSTDGKASDSSEKGGAQKADPAAYELPSPPQPMNANNRT